MKINYDQVIKQAKRIETAGGDLKSLGGEIQSFTTEISGAWQGQACKKYSSSIDELEIAVQNKAKKAARIAERISRIANEIKATDERTAANMKR